MSAQTPQPVPQVAIHQVGDGGPGVLQSAPMTPGARTPDSWERFVFVLEAAQDAQKEKAAVISLFSRGAKKRFAVVTPETTVQFAMANEATCPFIHELASHVHMFKKQGEVVCTLYSNHSFCLKMRLRKLIVMIPQLEGHLQFLVFQTRIRAHI